MTSVTRWKKRSGLVAIGAKLNMPPSTVQAVLTRCHLNKLHHVDVRTGEVVLRYEHATPGSLIHVDVKKLGDIPDGGGWRYVGRQQGSKNRAATAVEVLQRAVSWFAARGVTVERVLSDNDSAYKSRLWRDTCRDLNIKVKKTRPYRPQTNGKIKSFYGTLGVGWAFSRFYASTLQNQPVETPSQPGSTNTITTGPPPPSETTHPSAT